MKYFFVCAMLLCNALNGSSQNKRICVMGSSSAWGYFTINGNQLHPRDSGWAFKLKKHFKDQGKIDTLYNIAANSSNCYNGMPSSYVPPPNRSQYPPYYPFNITKAVQLVPRPDVIIVNYPSNQYDWLPVSEILFCLQTIKDSANAAGIQCFITTTQPRDRFSPSERQRLKDIRDQIMLKFGPWAIDFWTDVTVPVNLMKPEYNLGDSIHLTPEAHTLLKNRVVNANIFFIALPVSLTIFEAKKKATSVLLKWTTANETNSSHFLIEKSRDGKNFVSFATVTSSGNSSLPRNYSIEDKWPADGNNFYRIVSVDINSQKTFSKKLLANYDAGSFYASEIYSNPVANQLTIDFESGKKQTVHIRIVSSGGKTISNETIIMNKNLLFKKDISHIAAGRYLLSINTGKEIINRSFVKL
ncbi:MAG: T9SS type A sorting domain-containing protein [Sphingobacteriales bacterium]|nr:MAG: T9SS type A sorting domain-containing protein [Sphingobacteriales bacterium]